MAVFALLLFAFPFCKSKTDKPLEDGKINSVAEAQQVAKEMNKAVEQSTDRAAQRKAKGDTLAMPYKNLQNYLPEINGYSKDGGPKGSQMNLPGMGSWSQTEQEYVNGEKNISVKLVDYNAAYNTLLGATTVYKMGFSSEDDTKKQGAADLGLKDVAAYETIYKDGSRAELIVIVADRFFIEIESNGSNDAELIRSVAKNMKLDDLASK